MKKTRFLVLVLAVAVMMMGAGYAWWSETLTVDADVTTGKLEVDFNNAFVSQQDPWVRITTPTVSNDCLGILFENLYPDAGGEVTFGIKNNGTMAVRLAKDNAFVIDNIDGNSTPELGDDNYVCLSYLAEYDPAGTASDVQFTLNGSCLSYPSTAADITIAPGATARFKINAKLNKNADDTQELRDHVGFVFSPKFFQFNDQESH